MCDPQVRFCERPGGASPRAYSTRTRGGEPGRCLKTKRAVRPPVVVVVLPGCRDRPGVAEAVEDLQGQALVTESAVEALGEAVLPGATGLDVERRDADAIEPSSKLVGNELRTVVAADVLRHATHGEELREGIDHVGARDPAIGLQHQALPRELIDHREPLDLAATRRAIKDEVPAPDVVRCLGPTPMTAVGTRAQTTPFPLLLRILSPSRCQSRNTRDSPARHPSRTSSPPTLQ
jgi:hypothetical protein